MAELPMGGRMRTQQAGNSITTLANLAGAAVSVALLAGVGIWGYKLLVRDVTGVPVVRAAEGPMRITPAQPGGKPADHQGLAVNAVAGTGAAEGPVDRLALAPRPVALTEEDQPIGQIAQLERTSSFVTEQPAANAAEVDPIQALADAIAGDAAPLSDIANAPAAEVIATVTPTVDQTKPAPDVKLISMHSLHPRPRPQGLREASLARATDAVASAGAVLDVDPATIPAGTRLVQLGAFDSPEIARKEWDRLASRFDAFLDGKQRVIQRASSGGRVFYRLRAIGFQDLSDARQFCSTLVAQRTDCIPVVTR